jgi:hypothetical protein
MSAGCLFTDGRYILAGLQGTETQFISGFGGKALEGETYIDTAIRESLEELFHIQDVPADIIRTISIECMPQRYLQNGDYTILVYRFEDLFDWGLILNKSNVVSPLYDSIPLSVSDLLFKRKQLEETEIKCLSLLPLKKNLVISSHFLEDVSFLIEKIETVPTPMFQ